METATETPTETVRSRRERVTRPRQGRVLAGVASGLADQTGIDVGIVRTLFAVSLIFGGAGFFVYAAAWALLPSEGESRSPVERWFGNGDR